jgi:hypothetical protein
MQNKKGLLGKRNWNSSDRSLRAYKDMKCANKDCAKDFEPKTHNQKYCSDDCCRVATNKKIMEKYYEKKAIRSGSKRYNQLSICSKCEKNNSSSDRSKLLRMINDIS